jgi:hypothetical protein
MLNLSSSESDPSETLAANFAVMHNAAFRKNSCGKEKPRLRQLLPVGL